MQKVTLQITVLIPANSCKSISIRAIKCRIKEALTHICSHRRIKIVTKRTGADWNDCSDITQATHYCNAYGWLIWYEDGMSDPRYWSNGTWYKATDLSISDCISLTPAR